jgi:hypothetical protein
MRQAQVGYWAEMQSDLRPVSECTVNLHLGMHRSSKQVGEPQVKTVLPRAVTHDFRNQAINSLYQKHLWSKMSPTQWMVVKSIMNRQTTKAKQTTVQIWSCLCSGFRNKSCLIKRNQTKLTWPNSTLQDVIFQLSTGDAQDCLQTHFAACEVHCVAFFLEVVVI